MKKLVFRLNKSWPRTQRAIVMVKRLSVLLPIDSLTVENYEDFVELVIIVAPEHLGIVSDLVGKIIDRTKPKQTIQPDS